MLLFYIYVNYSYLCDLNNKIMRLNIEKVMKEKGLNALMLSEKMGENGTPLSRITIGSILNQNSSPKLETLQSIADTLEVPLFELFDGYVPNGMVPVFKRDDDGNYIEIGFLKKQHHAKKENNG